MYASPIWVQDYYYTLIQSWRISYLSFISDLQGSHELFAKVKIAFFAAALLTDMLDHVILLAYQLILKKIIQSSNKQYSNTAEPLNSEQFDFAVILLL